MISFNVPPVTGKEIIYMQDAISRNKICGDGYYTKLCNKWIEDTTGIAKALLTTSCTHATELAAILCDIKPGDEVIMPSILLYQLQMPLCCVAQKLYLLTFVQIQ